jgi:hypothetical protein
MREVPSKKWQGFRRGREEGEQKERRDVYLHAVLFVTIPHDA